MDALALGYLWLVAFILGVYFLIRAVAATYTVNRLPEALPSRKAGPCCGGHCSLPRRK